MSETCPPAHGDRLRFYRLCPLNPFLLFPENSLLSALRQTAKSRNHQKNKKTQKIKIDIESTIKIGMKSQWIAIQPIKERVSPIDRDKYGVSFSVNFRQKPQNRKMDMVYDDRGGRTVRGCFSVQTLSPSAYTFSASSSWFCDTKTAPFRT